MSVKMYRKQLKIAVNRLCKECVYAYVHRREPFAFLGRELAISDIMAFYDELMRKK